MVFWVRMHGFVQLYHVDVILPDTVDLQIVPGESLIDKLVFFQRAQGAFISRHHIGLQAVETQFAKGKVCDKSQGIGDIALIDVVFV